MGLQTHRLYILLAYHVSITWDGEGEGQTMLFTILKASRAMTMRMPRMEKKIRVIAVAGLMDSAVRGAVGRERSVERGLGGRVGRRGRLSIVVGESMGC